MKRGLHKMVELAPLCQLDQETLKIFHPPIIKLTPAPTPIPGFPCISIINFWSPHYNHFWKISSGGEGGYNGIFFRNVPVWYLLLLDTPTNSIKEEQKSFKNLTLSLLVLCWAGHNTNLTSDSNISKTVRVNIAFDKTFFKKIFKLSNGIQVNRIYTCGSQVIDV